MFFNPAIPVPTIYPKAIVRNNKIIISSILSSFLITKMEIIEYLTLGSWLAKF